MTIMKLNPASAADGQTTPVGEIAGKLTKAQRRVLCDVADGGCFFGAFREPGDFMKDGILFSELVKIVVHRSSARVEDRYLIRNKTAEPLYLGGLVTHAIGDSGFRCFRATPLGLAVRNLLSEGPAHD